MTSNPPTLTRRQAVGRLATLLAAGCWPGALRGATTDVGVVRFVVANDFHHDSAECDPWFEKLFAQIGRHEGLSFCAGLGDLANRGRPESIAAIVRIAGKIGVPFYAVPGNHDNDLEATTRIYADVCPGRLNYHWEEKGWQFVAIDSTDGKAWGHTKVSKETLAWLDDALPQLDRRRPTVLCTHFPLTVIRELTPLNAEAVLERFVSFNLRGVFSGHFHGQTCEERGAYTLVTDACCSRVANNHDGTLRKGYWLVAATPNGALDRSFVEFSG
jgi:3',5'-cyclic AMP phosphodiesterase CpdA